MNDWISLIDERISKSTSNMMFVRSEICEVLSVDSNDRNKVTVNVKSTGANYTVKNYSGSDVSVGEYVQLFYKGGMIAEETAYIGASLNKNTGVSPNAVIIIGSSNTGTITGGTKDISEIGFSCEDSVNGLVYVNFNIKGTSASSINVLITIDETTLNYSPIQTLSSNQKQNISFTVPFSVEGGDHITKITVIGEGEILDVGSFIGAQDITIYNPPTPEPPVYNAPMELLCKLDSAGQSVIAAGETFTPDEAPTHIMGITGFVNGRGLSYDGTDATRIITQDLYNLPAANYLTLSGTKPAGKSLKFEFNYYTYTNSYVSYYIGIPEGTMEYSMSAIQNWWAGYQLSKFKLIVGYTDNSNISPSDVNIQISYKGY